MSGYLRGFSKTGNEDIDSILDAISAAGDGFHNTSEWGEPLDGLEGKSYLDLIQEKADIAAANMNNPTDN